MVTWDYQGASNLKELNFLMNHYVMIRRLKKDLLDLPIKRREKIIVKIDENFEKELKELAHQLEEAYKLKTNTKEESELSKNSSVQHSLTFKLYRNTGIYKVKNF